MTTLSRALWTGLVLWGILMVLSAFALTAAPTGDGFVRGANVVLGFLGWQFAAAVLSVVLWLFSRSLPKDALVRWIALGTVCWSALLALSIAGWIGYGLYIGG